MTPKSSSLTLMSRRAVARTVPSSTGTSYVFPVRLSVMVSVSEAVATPPPLLLCSSVPIGISRSRSRSSSSTRNDDGYDLFAAERPGGTASGRGDGGRHGEHHEQRGEADDAARLALAGGEAADAGDP